MIISEVPGNDGYFVDSNGFVYSQWVNRGMHGVVKDSVLHKLKTSKSKSGHLTVRFGRGGESNYVHRLVYTLLIGEIPEGLYICHADGNPENNNIENLYAGTQRQNMSDSVKHGTCALMKLNEEQVKEILSLRKNMMVKDIAYLYGVQRHTITDICRGKTWTHIKREEVI